MTPVSTDTNKSRSGLPHPGFFSFDVTEYAPEKSTWKLPSWARQDGKKEYETSKVNGLGDDWD